MTAVANYRSGSIVAAHVRAAKHANRRFTLHDEARPRVDAAARLIATIAQGSESVYGVNTGFGKLALAKVPPAQVEQLQVNLVVSHACGVGPALAPEVVRLILMLKINSLARGFSGVRWSVIETLEACLEHDLLPVIPAKGSVGASGDLAPLAHLAATLIGVGDATFRGERMHAANALERAGIAPLTLHAKEGLALLNGTQVSTALALDALIGAEDLLAGSLVAGALTVEAALGSTAPFDERIHAIRGQRAQVDIAAELRRLLGASQINESHRDCGRVQDPYSLRCMPQVLGACLATLRSATATLIDEANGVSDNPLVFADTGEVISGGNFHAEPIAFVADALAVAIAEIGSISERRSALLVDPTFSALPAFLATNPGLESGFMIPQVTAAALVSENKMLSHPASVDSIPTSAGQEDHVSMATHGAYRLRAMLQNARDVIAIELLAAVRGIGFRRPLRTSEMLETAIDRIAPDTATGDRYIAPDIARVSDLIASASFTPMVASLFGSTDAAV